MNRAGVTVIVVEQSINVALTLARRAVFMEKGEFRFTGPTSALLDRPDILRHVAAARCEPADPSGGRSVAAASFISWPLPVSHPGGCRFSGSPVVGHPAGRET